MIVMPANNTGLIVGFLAGSFPSRIAHLYSPGGQRGPFPFIDFSLDNGVFGAGSNWCPGPWIDLLDWCVENDRSPMWALVPDAVGDRDLTLKRWSEFADRTAEFGWPLAFAVQDGMTVSDVPADAAVVFVGGSTRWKWDTYRLWCDSFPRVHIGRVNSYERLMGCYQAGAESVDGTGWTRGGEKRIEGLTRFLLETDNKRRIR